MRKIILSLLIALVFIAPSFGATDYGNLGGSGNRIMSATASSGLIGAGSVTTFIDGLPTGTYFANGLDTSLHWMKFDFGSGRAKCVYGIVITMSGAQSQGVWKIQGSNNDSDWTDIGSSFTYGSSTPQTVSLSGNTTDYRYYKFQGVSGTTSHLKNTLEIDFKYISSIGNVVEFTANSACMTAPLTLLDGSYSNTVYFGNGLDVSTINLTFDFGETASKIIDEIKCYFSAIQSQGVWQIQGSNNNSDWTNIGSQFTLGASATQTISLSGNTTGHRYYRFQGISGSTSWNNYFREVEFKIDDAATTDINKIAGVDYTNINQVSGIGLANVDKVAGINSLSTTVITTTWYVRPQQDTDYGNGRGDSYDNAFNGVYGIRWSCIKPGDEIYVCDMHTATTISWNIQKSGEDGNEIVFRGDYPDHAGIIDASTYATISFNANEYIKFSNLSFIKFYCMVLTDISDITFEDCTFTNQYTGSWSFFDLYGKNDNWIFDGCTFINGKNGIYTHTASPSADNLVVRNCIFNGMGNAPYENADAHAIGIQGGTGHIIEDNYTEDTGAAILFYNAGETFGMGNHIIRRNFIKDVRNVAMGGGITVYDNCTHEDSEMTWDISYNILSNCYGGIYLGVRSEKTFNVYNNTLLDCGQAYGVAIVINALAGITMNGVIQNNIVAKPYDRDIEIWTGINNVTVSNNLEYDEEDDPIFAEAEPTEPEHFVPTNAEYINAGVDLGQTVDYFGNAMVGNPDIGAIEYQ